MRPIFQCRNDVSSENELLILLLFVHTHKNTDVVEKTDFLNCCCSSCKLSECPPNEDKKKILVYFLSA